MRNYFSLILILSMFSVSGLTFANDYKNQEEKQINLSNGLVFEAEQTLNAESTCSDIQVLSQIELDETKGARSYRYTCLSCTAKHGGVYSPYYCHNCWNKR